LPADTVVAALGFTADLGPLAEWGLELTAAHSGGTARWRRTCRGCSPPANIVGVPGQGAADRHRFGEAATAVNNAAVAINPAAHLFPGHSSEAG
jgi:thioredoxin reductase (NADPH)